MSLSKEQLQMHGTHITASQVPTIMGHNDFETRQSLMRSKVDPRPDLREMSEAAWRGHMLEDITARLCLLKIERDLGVSVNYEAAVMMPRDFFEAVEIGPGLRIPKTMVVGDSLKAKNASDRFAATPDRLITRVPREFLLPGQDPGTALLNYEIKTGSSTSGWSGDSVPYKYVLQVQWQMAILRSWGFDVQATLIGGLIASNPVFRFVKYDHALVVEIVKHVEKFLEDVEAHKAAGTVPELGEWSDDEREKVELHDLDEDTLASFEEMLELHEQISTLERRRDDLKERLAGHGSSYRSINSHTHSIQFRAPGTRTIRSHGKFASKLANKLKVLGYDGLVERYRDETTFTMNTKPALIIKRKKGA